MESPHDIVIVGGGIVGLATAYQLLVRRPGTSLTVLEKEPELAQHQSGHNSGVLHAGLYYAPGSLKARLCREGKAELERFAEEHAVPFERCGKLVVAVRNQELGRLADLEQRGRANGVPDLEMVGPERIREIEPHTVGIRALWSPSTGIIDFSSVAIALAGEITARGGTILTGQRVQGIRRGAMWVLDTDRHEMLARHVITCAGLHSDRVAAMTRGAPTPRIVPFRGSYLQLRPSARTLVRGLIYPVPDPGLPFLGVHFTRRMDGEVWVGPNAVLAFAREGYRARDVSLRDLASIFRFPGFWRLARRHYPEGITELTRYFVRGALVRELQRYVPEVRRADLAPGPSGVRAQAVAGDGGLVDDFALTEGPDVIHVRNAPSPAATASLAIGRHLADRAEARFGLGAAG